MPVHSIGINEDGVDSMKNRFCSRCASLNWSGESSLVVVKDKSHMPVWKGSFKHDDFQLFNCWIMMPLTGSEEYNYIFLGYKNFEPVFSQLTEDA